MLKQMDKRERVIKFFNFRSLFFVFVIGALCIYFSFHLSSSLYNLIFFVVPLGFLVYVATRKQYALLMFSAIFFLSTSLFTSLYITNYVDKNYSNTPVHITAKIVKITDVNDNFYYLTLSNATVIHENNTTAKISGNISVGVNVYDSDEQFDLPLFAQIAFSARLSGVGAKDEFGNPNVLFLKWNIKYETNAVNYTSISFLKDDSSLIEKFQGYNRGLLVGNFGEEKGDLMYCLLYGDRTSSIDGYVEVFSYAGVVHVLSVSGLHVALIVFLLIFFLKRFRLCERTRFLIVLCFLVVFCTLCSFSAPVIRSSIMSLILLVSSMFLHKNDAFNAISFAGILILLFSPLSVFDVGFQLSFASVFGIILTINSIKLIIKNRRTYLILLPIFTSLSAQLMILPIISNSFGVVPTWSIFFNIIILPLFSLMYSILFVTNILAVICPFLWILYTIPSALLDVILFIVSFVRYLPANTFTLPNITLFSTIIFYFIFLVASKYVVVRLFGKIALSVTLVFVLAFSMFLSSLPLIRFQNLLKFYESESSFGTLLCTKQNKYYLIEPKLNYGKQIADELKRLNIFKLSAVILLTNENFQSAQVNKYLGDFSPEIYLQAGNIHDVGLSAFGFVTHKIGADKTIVDETFAIKYFDYNSSPFALSLEFMSRRIVFLVGDTVIDSNLQNFITTNFDYTINCARIIGGDSAQWRGEIVAQNYFFDSQSRLQYLLT